MQPSRHLGKLVVVFCLSVLLGYTACAQEASMGELAARYDPKAYLSRQKHAVVHVLTVNEGARRAYAFVPDAPRSNAVPVVFFHHGWLGVSPKNFGALIDHLVRRGAVVIYPVYQDIPQTMPREITALAAAADREALRAVDREYPGMIDHDKVMYYGYSMGAAISLNLALAPEKYGLPAPRALALMAPGDAKHVVRGPEAASIIGDVSKLPPELAVALVAGSADTSIGLPTARELASRMCQLRRDRRTLLILPSDESGGTHVKAGHSSPGAPDTRYDFPDSRAPVAEATPPRADFESSPSLNFLDFGGYWKVVAGLLDWIDFGRYPDDVFGRNAAVRFLGQWPDGTPYKPAVIEEPCPERG